MAVALEADLVRLHDAGSPYSGRAAHAVRGPGQVTYLSNWRRRASQGSRRPAREQSDYQSPLHHPSEDGLAGVPKGIDTLPPSSIA